MGFWSWLFEDQDWWCFFGWAFLVELFWPVALYQRSKSQDLLFRELFTFSQSLFCRVALVTRFRWLFDDQDNYFKISVARIFTLFCWDFNFFRRPIFSLKILGKLFKNQATFWSQWWFLKRSRGLFYFFCKLFASIAWCFLKININPRHFLSIAHFLLFWWAFLEIKKKSQARDKNQN